MVSLCASVRYILLFSLLTLVLCALSARADDTAAGQKDGDVEEDEAARAAAEEAAAAAVEEEAEEEEDEEGDALDEDADSARYDPESPIHPLSNLPPANKDIHVGHAFQSGMLVDNKTSQGLLTLGEPVKTVIGFSNDAKTPIHVWGVIGSLNHHTHFPTFVQNFSYSVVNYTVPSGKEVSFPYTFTPNAHLDVRPFQLAITVFYEAQGSSGAAIRGHSTTFFNSTMLTQPGSQTMSNATFMLFFVTVVAAVVGAVYLFRNMEDEKKKDVVETGTADTSKNEWLEEHHNMMKTGGGRGKAKGETKH